MCLQESFFEFLDKCFFFHCYCLMYCINLNNGVFDLVFSSIFVKSKNLLFWFSMQCEESLKQHF